MRRRYIIQFAVALSVVALAIACLTMPGICQKTSQVNTPGTTGSLPAGTGQGVSGGQPMGMPSKAAPAMPQSMATAKPTMSATGMPTAAAPTKAVATTAKASPSAMASPVSSAIAAPRGTAGEQGRTSVSGGTTGAGVSGGGVTGGYVIQVSNYAFVTQTINPGGVINGYVELQNTGSSVINDALISLSLVPVDRPSTIVATRDQALSNLNIQPGETRRVDFSINAPGDVTAGNYNAQATVKANGQDIKSFTGAVRVA